MTIERLEELQMSVQYAFAVLANDFPKSKQVQKDYNDVQKLIEAEIERIEEK